MKKFVAELIGTFMLVFIGTGAVVFGNGLNGLGHLGIAFAFGLAIVVAAFSIGTVSGAHLNPAVSIAMFVNKRLSSSELVNYILGQVVGAFLASAAVFFLLSNSGMSTASLGENALANGVTVFGGFLFEVIATFLVCPSYHDCNISKQGQWCNRWFGNRFVIDSLDPCRLEHHWTFSKPSS